jgi:CubicO group peptidase (beta-lactamase class C family)
MPLQSLFAWHAYPSELAVTAPWWEPGTQHGYHALTFGYLVGEVIRRISGMSVGQFFRAEVAGPLPGDTSFRDAIMHDPTSMAGRAFLNPPRGTAVMGSREWRVAEIPAANGHTTARALARIYGALA